MSGFWNRLGKALAITAKAAGKGALWCSEHPEVVATVATIAGHPDVAAVVKGLSTATTKAAQ